MKKAFIFDMDGVIVDSENAWIPYEEKFLKNLVGEEIYTKIGDTVGMGVKIIYQRATECGLNLDRKTFYEKYDEQAEIIYKKAKITNNFDKLCNFLVKNKIKLGIVSSSRKTWINMVLPFLSFKDKFEVIISLCDREDLQSKPYPDGYLEAMKKLNAKPEETIILEDSNTGIQSATASGAYVISFSGNLVPGYKQIKADVNAKNMIEVIKIVEEIIVSGECKVFGTPFSQNTITF